MTTTPNPISTQATVTSSWLASEIMWVKAHEKLLIVALSGFLLYRTGQGIENIILKRDATAAQQAANIVKTDDTANAASQKALDQMKATADAQITALNSLIAKSQSDLAAQIKKDVASTPTQIDTRWRELLPLPSGSVTALDPVTTKVTDTAANETVQALEQLPILQAQVVNLTTEIADDQKIITQQDATITGLNKEIADEKIQDAADVKLAEAKSKKSFWHGFKIGLVVGAVGTEAIRLWAGHP